MARKKKVKHETDAEIAAKQQAIGDAWERFDQEHVDEVPYDPPEGDHERSEYPSFHTLASADPAQLAEFDKAVAEELARVAGD